jgi:cyclopropane fatty-acyl-phospholipid synthase-like methyltransferase
VTAVYPQTDQLVPPAEELPPYAEAWEYLEIGNTFLESAIAHGLQPHHNVLDVGCGVGRFAVAVAGYLDSEGSYVGIDNSRKAVRLCREHIGSKIESFNFRYIRAFNEHYAANVRHDAADVRFPLHSRRFDFVFSNSLFTHLLPADAANYIRQIRRVLVPGGITLNTMFLLNDESRALLERADALPGKTYEFEDGSRIKKPDSPSAWIAHDEQHIVAAHEEAKLQIETIRYGSWTGNREKSGPGFGSKDHVVATRPHRKKQKRRFGIPVRR